ncbi:hypothetical protein [Streptomyces sp. NPDC056464]|uniref:hypothetical protein n=1 Tax=Streptomyces sp. NPDC056464 TaxID=3345828 RepID=UPI0036AC6226
MTNSRSVHMHVTLAVLAAVLLLLGVFVIARTVVSGDDSGPDAGARPDAAGSGAQAGGDGGESAGGGQGEGGGADADGGGNGGSRPGTNGRHPGSIRLPGATVDNAYPIYEFPNFKALDDSRSGGCFAPANHSPAVPLTIVSVWRSNADNIDLVHGCAGDDLVGSHPIRAGEVPLSQGCPQGTVLEPDYGSGCTLWVETDTPGSSQATVNVQVEATCTSHAAWPCDSRELAGYDLSPQRPIVVRLTESQVITFAGPSPGVTPGEPTSSPSPDVENSPTAVDGSPSEEVPSDPAGSGA